MLRGSTGAPPYRLCFRTSPPWLAKLVEGDPPQLAELAVGESPPFANWSLGGHVSPPPPSND